LKRDASSRQGKGWKSAFDAFALYSGDFLRKNSLRSLEKADKQNDSPMLPEKESKSAIVRKS
jgi:hypothetical protein